MTILTTVACLSCRGAVCYESVAARLRRVSRKPARRAASQPRSRARCMQKRNCAAPEHHRGGSLLCGAVNADTWTTIKNHQLISNFTNKHDSNYYFSFPRAQWSLQQGKWRLSWRFFFYIGENLKRSASLTLATFLTVSSMLRFLGQ